VTRAQFVDKLAKDLEITKKKAAEALDLTLASIKDAVSAGEAVTFVGFGSFKMVERTAREGRNPATGKTVKIPAKKAVKFTAGKPFKETLNVKKGKKK
jgi:DNA-binding protein HU-beta